MTRRVLGMISLLLVLLIGGCGGSQGLALRFTKGESVSYHVNTTADIVVQNVQAPPAVAELLKATLTMKMALSFDAAIRFEDVNDGIATVKYQVSGFKGEAEVAGRKQPLPSTLLSSEVTVKVNTKTGQVLEIQGLPEKADGTPADTEQFKSALRQSFTQLPKSGQAKLGDSWDVSNPVPVILPNANGKAEMKAHFKYEEDVTRGTKRLAKLSETTDASLNIDMTVQGHSMRATGTISGNGVDYVDLQNGLPESSTTDATAKMSQTMDLGAPYGSAVVDYQMTMHTELTSK